MNGRKNLELNYVRERYREIIISIESGGNAVI